MTIAFQSCTVAWPQDRSLSSANPSAASTPRNKFILADLNLNFPPGELSLICGRLGSGKTLMLLGQMLCPQSPPDSLASFSTIVPKEEWVMPGICAYVPQPGIISIGLIFATIRFFALYSGLIHASTVLYKSLLEAVLFANIRFHDTVSRGRLLNRFGKDFEEIDSSLPDNFGRSIMYGLSALTTITTISVMGGAPFVIAVLVLGAFYYNDLPSSCQDSVTRSSLYSIYGETISGVTILCAFGASSKFLRNMLRCVDTCDYWCYCPRGTGDSKDQRISPPAGFTLAFASTITVDLLFTVRRFVGLEQSMVALERVKEYSELTREPPEFTEVRPPASWPHSGAIKCENFVIRYSPELPDVLHNLNFEIQPGEKVSKSTLALSFFRFVEATEGRISVDDMDITEIGLIDLRSKLTIIPLKTFPEDPTILSGSPRSTLDVFEEYSDAEIYEAFRCVHLIPPEGIATEAEDTVNANVFRDLDSPVSEGGENFSTECVSFIEPKYSLTSTSEKQLLCMARAVLKRSKVLIMDEATASIDYATDELISKTIRQEFATSTILTVAHRLRTVIDYDRVWASPYGSSFSELAQFFPCTNLASPWPGQLHDVSTNAKGMMRFPPKTLVGSYNTGPGNGSPEWHAWVLNKHF
ncbi:P-loop containing nucleoside triphosphate hydrolase protein [Infundibulicybe gibba]|nr:P-loop containing nucleoside triphosphate hydrolase protein [Infundibulicybe gibba]